MAPLLPIIWYIFLDIQMSQVLLQIAPPHLTLSCHLALAQLTKGMFWLTSKLANSLHFLLALAILALTATSAPPSDIPLEALPRDPWHKLHAHSYLLLCSHLSPEHPWHQTEFTLTPDPWPSYGYSPLCGLTAGLLPTTIIFVLSIFTFKPPDNLLLSLRLSTYNNSQSFVTSCITTTNNRGLSVEPWCTQTPDVPASALTSAHTIASVHKNMK